MSGGPSDEERPVVSPPSSQGGASSASSSQLKSSDSGASNSQQQRPVMSVRVLAETNEGNRPHMEDVTCCVFDKSRVGGQAFLAVFDGHGGRQAALYARDHLWDNMKRQPGFNSDDHDQVKAAMRQAFMETQRGMESVVRTWPRARYGLPSTSGTTASVVVLRGRVLYTAHLGDSGIVLGRKRQPVADDGTPSSRSAAADRPSSRLSSPEPSSFSSASDDSEIAELLLSSSEAASDEDEDEEFETVSLTVDHKPDSYEERRAIEARGGKVRCGTRGVSRVVWKRKRPLNGRTVLNMTHSELVTEEIPFLGVARSLGDLWSYNPDIGDYIVSCVPDVSHRTLTIDEDHFIVLASDGLWNVLTPKMAVRTVAKHTSQVRTCAAAETGEEATERSNRPDRHDDADPDADAAEAGGVGGLDDICHGLIQLALQRWRDRRQRADNISVIVAFFNQPSNQPSSQSSQSSLASNSRTPTPILPTEQATAATTPPTEASAEVAAPAVANADPEMQPLPQSPLNSNDSSPGPKALVSPEAGDVSSSEESSLSSSSSSDVPSPPLLRRTTRVQARSGSVAAGNAAAFDVDTPPSDEGAATTPSARVTRAAARRTPSSSPATNSPAAARPAKRRSTPTSAEGQAKRVSRSAAALGPSDKTPLQEDVVSSSSSSEDSAE